MHRLVYKIESQQIVKSLYITIEPQKLVKSMSIRNGLVLFFIFPAKLQ